MPKKTSKKIAAKTNRISMEEMFSGLYVPNPGKISRKKTPEKRTTVLYGMVGSSSSRDNKNNTIVTNTEDALAKEIQGVSPAYFLLADRTKFKNPLDENHKTDRIKGITRWKWVEVSEKTFKFYLKFLQTQATRYLISAEKEQYG